MRTEIGPPIALAAGVSVNRTPDVPRTAQSFMMFPGEDQDSFGFGYTAREALSWLLSQEPEAVNHLESGGCVHLTVFGRPHSVAGALPVLNTSVSDIQIRTRSADGAGMTWSFQHRVTALDEGFTNVFPQSSSAKAPCDLRRGSIVGLADFKAYLEGLRPTHDKAFFSYGFDLEAPDEGTFVPGIETSERYELMYQPDSVTCSASCSFIPDHVTFRATNLLQVELMSDARRGLR